MQHPTVAECCVLGLPDKDYGEAVTAIIVPETEAKKKREDESKPVMTLEELNGWAKDKLAPYKVLKNLPSSYPNICRNYSTIHTHNYM